MVEQLLDWNDIEDAVNAARVEKYPEVKDDPAGCEPIPHWGLIKRIVEQRVAKLIARAQREAQQSIRRPVPHSLVRVLPREDDDA